MGILSKEAIRLLGFKSVGEGIQISDKVSIYGAERITLGNNIRIDDFAILSAGEGGIIIGNYVHIAFGSSLVGAGKITLSNFSGISSRVSIYSSTDDYSGSFMTNPTVPKEFTNSIDGDVFLGEHVIIGSGSVVLPGTTLDMGAAIGALSMVNKNCESCWIYFGAPIRKVKKRKSNFLEYEKKLLSMFNFIGKS